MGKNVKKGFTLIELIVVITIMGLIGGTVTSLLLFGYNVYGDVSEDFDAQVALRSSLQELSKTMRFAKAMFAVPGTEYLDDEWNYIGLNEDKTMIIDYKWDPVSETHIETVMMGPYDGVTFNIGFYKEDNMNKDNTIQVYFEMYSKNGTVQRFNIQTGYEALNSLQVVDYGTELVPATALAYRSDEFHFENYLLKVNITLILDVSGSMNWNLNGNTTSTLSSRRNYILKEKTRGLIESFAQNSNDDIEINIALVPFSTSGNGIKVFRNVKTEKAQLLSDVDSLCSGNSYNCSGGTNTGDGMRRAYYALLTKSQNQADNMSLTRDTKIKNYNIFLTDGETTYRTVHQIENGTETVRVCYWGNWYCVWETRPVYIRDYYTADGNISESTNSTYPDPFLGGNGQDTSDENNEYVSIIGDMLGGVLPINNYTEEELYVTNYIIGFTGSVSNAAINYIATSTNTPTERIYMAADGDSLALSFSEIQLSITNDTWHYLGPKLVED